MVLSVSINILGGTKNALIFQHGEKVVHKQTGIFICVNALNAPQYDDTRVQRQRGGKRIKKRRCSYVADP